jgi:hypothetical protein
MFTSTSAEAEESYFNPRVFVLHSRTNHKLYEQHTKRGLRTEMGVLLGFSQQMHFRSLSVTVTNI